MYRSESDAYWLGKTKKIRDLLGRWSSKVLFFSRIFSKIDHFSGEQKFAVKGKGDAWSGFLYRIREAPHMTDGFCEFYCLYLQGTIL